MLLLRSLDPAMAALLLLPLLLMNLVVPVRLSDDLDRLAEPDAPGAECSAATMPREQCVYDTCYPDRALWSPAEDDPATGERASCGFCYCVAER